MTVLYTNTFTKADGQVPDDYVLSGVGGAVCFNQKWHLSTNNAGDTVKGVLPAAKWFEADGKCTAWWTTNTPATGNVVPQVMMRTSGDWSTELDTPTTGYKLLFVNGLGIGIFERHGGVTTMLNGGVWIPKTIAPAQTYGFTLQVQGNQIAGRMWQGVEPGGWDIGPLTNGAVTGPGQHQVALLSQDPGLQIVDFDDISLDNLIVPVQSTAARPRLVTI